MIIYKNVSAIVNVNTIPLSEEIQGMLPGFLLGSVPALWGKNTPVPDDLCPDSKKIACIPGPPLACFGL